MSALIAATMSVPAGALAADVYSVAPGTTDAAATSCTPTGSGTFSCANLRSAVAAAESDNGSTIQLSAGTYTLATGHLSINAGGNSLALAGAGSNQTTIQQTGAFRVMNLNSGTMTLSGVTVTGGNQTTHNGLCPGPSNTTEVTGGGILNAGTLTLSDVAVTGNSATGTDGASVTSGTAGAGVDAYGGGICSAGQLTLMNSSVTGNTVTGGLGGVGSLTANGGQGGSGFGGGIASGAGLGIISSTVATNHATGGKGGDAGSGAAGNGGDGDGGGILAVSGGGSPFSFGLGLSAVLGNAALGGRGGDASSGQAGAGGAADGSGIFTASVVPTITASTVAGGNALGGDGGGVTAGADVGAGGGTMAALTVTGVPLALSRSTVSGNTEAVGRQGTTGGAAPIVSTGGLGGGILMDHGGTIVNATIAGNTVAGHIGDEIDGGGIYNAGALSLASVTIASNSASGSGGHGGNLFASPSSVTASDTIISGGVAAADANCNGAVAADGGHNLESTSPSQCGFSSANGDVIGSDPLLAAPADNGGPTATMALGAGSPAIGAGGQCADPANAGAPLTVDQRGLPRGNPCDIGAFDGQPPVVSAPAIMGAGGVGQTLACNQGSVAGDQPLTLSLQWLRDDQPIAGATAPAYTIVAADAGRRLACQEGASNPYGSAAATSVAVAVAAQRPPTPKITNLRQSHKKWREGKKLAKVARRRPPVGDTFRFTLNTDAKLKLTFTHKVRRHGRTRTVTAGTVTFKTARAGHRKIVFQGRLSRHKKLHRGTYTLRITATNSSGHGVSKPLTFKIV
jgi:hypothetical protein